MEWVAVSFSKETHIHGCVYICVCVCVCIYVYVVYTFLQFTICVCALAIDYGSAFLIVMASYSIDTI